jgi:hypothetical protein
MKVLMRHQFMDDAFSHLWFIQLHVLYAYLSLQSRYGNKKLEANQILTKFLGHYRLLLKVCFSTKQEMPVSNFSACVNAGFFGFHILITFHDKPRKKLNMCWMHVL